MPICNTVTCTGYYSMLTTQGAVPNDFWVKDKFGNNLNAVWGQPIPMYSETWIGVYFGDSANAKVGQITVYDCNHLVVTHYDLNITAATQWRKWQWLQSFGTNCAKALINQGAGQGPLPATPPPAGS